MDQLDSIFQMFFDTILNVAKYIFAMRMASDIIKNYNSGDLQGIFKAIITAGVAYAMLFSIIDILNSIQSSFK